MTNILVLYYSRQGNTAKMAQLIARGVEQIDGANAILRCVPPVSQTTEAIESEIPESGSPYVQKSDIIQCDGLALGSPTRFGNMAAPLKYFLEQLSDIWLSGDLNGKPACVFTSTGSLHGGQETTLLSMMLPLFHQGMMLLGLPYPNTDLMTTQSGGTPYGCSHLAGTDSQRQVDTDERAMCIYQGKRLAQVASSLKNS
ncbi:MAG: NAD(P)H:quinone oxidoreductase [Pseudomonadota bacterium]